MLDRLSLFDASLLAMETPSTPLHSGGVSIFEPGLEFSGVLSTLRDRLDLVSRARKRVRSAPFGGRPVWVDDTDFDLSYHLRHAGLPPPGDPGQLGEVLSRLLARPLDRSRPLWEMYVIEGLEGGRTAMFRKAHLAMSGGEYGDPFAVLLDEAAEPPAALVGRAPAWRPEPAPTPATLAVASVRDRAGNTLELGREVVGLVTSPRRFADVALSAAGAAVNLASRAARQAPPSPLNRRLTPHRRFATARADLEDLRAIRRVFGGTINDSVVAVAADAVGRLLRWRGYETKDLDLRVMVPVLVDAGAAADGEMARSVGEGAVGVIAPLPVMEMDPVARLYRIMGELAGIKESRQAVAAERLLRAAGYGPANLHATAARLVIGEQRYNVALSNAPGPQRPRWLNGVQLQESYPAIPLAGDATLSIAVTSYNGAMYFGLLGDRSSMPDLDRLAVFIGDAVATLVDAADGRSA